jgi:hypothetical protein
VGDREFFFVDGFGRRFGGDAKTPLMSITATFDADRDHLELRLRTGRPWRGPRAQKETRSP